MEMHYLKPEITVVQTEYLMDSTWTTGGSTNEAPTANRATIDDEEETDNASTPTAQLNITFRSAWDDDIDKSL